MDNEEQCNEELADKAIFFKKSRFVVANAKGREVEVQELSPTSRKVGPTAAARWRLAKVASRSLSKFEKVRKAGVLKKAVYTAYLAA